MTRFSPFLKQCSVTGAVCCNIVGHGSTFGFPGVLLPQLQGPGATLSVSNEAGSWIASAMAITLFMGSFLAQPLMSRWGRKPAHFAVIFSGILGWLVIASAWNIWILILGRVIQGLSFGVFMPLRPVLIGEYTSPRYRGGFLTMISLSQTLGVFIVHLIGALLPWKYTALACSVFPLLGFFLTLYTPESPAWLALQGEYDKCRDAFHWLRGTEEEEELNRMILTRVAAQEQRDYGPKTKKFEDMKMIVRKQEVYKPVLLVMHVFLLAQFAGSLTMANYAKPVIVTVVGPDAEVNLWMLMLDINRFVANVVAVYIVNKLQRRMMIFSTGGVCVVAHFVIAGYVYSKDRDILPYDAPWISGLLLNVHMASVGVGMLPMPSVIAGEVYPLQHRSLLASISAGVVAITMFITLKTFPPLCKSVGLHGTYLIYGSILAYSMIWIWFLLPETKGKTLQEIEEHFQGKKLPVHEEAQFETKPLKETIHSTDVTCAV